MDPKLQGIVQVISIAEMVLGSDMIPALARFFGKEYQLTPEQQAELQQGYEQLLAVQVQARQRRAEIG